MVLLGSKLKELRLKDDESLQDVATAVGVSKGYVWQLERDEDINPSIEVIKKLADHFRTTVGALIGESSLPEDVQMVRMFRGLGDLETKDRDVVEDLIEALRKRRSDESSAG